MPTVESIMRQQKIRRNLFRALFVLFLVVLCILIGWFIGTIGEKKSPLSFNAPATWIHSRT